MTKKVNFQWQNEHLLRTIYPLREMKLRDFLVYYKEFELWAEHKDRDLSDQDVKADILAYTLAQEKEMRKLHARYHEVLMYFKGDILDFTRASAVVPLIQDYVRKLLAEHRNFQRFFFSYNSSRKQQFYLDGYIMRVEGWQTLLKKQVERLNRNLRNFRATMPDSHKIPEWEAELVENENTLKLVNTEVGKLYELFGFFNKIKKDIDVILKYLDRFRNSTDPEIAALKDHEPGQVIRLLEKQVTRKRVEIKDIVQWKSEAFEKELEKLDHEGLVERIVNRFLDEPTRYPLWLQYMVIHFSGMRYKSAHGSWGDPKDILLSLKIKSIDDKLKSDEPEILQAQAAIEAGVLRSLPDSDTRENQRTIAALESPNMFVVRRALQNAWTDKKQDLIESMSEEQVLKELEEMSDQLPTWMWKEIVMRTDLRLAHADADWETLSEEDKEGYYDRMNSEFREILVNWKAKNLTMWREEHNRANKLIVTRAVCNEVAEHIQHLRGISPPGGLTAKPIWYRNEEKAAVFSDSEEKPFLTKINQFSDFKSGASILWLRWVNGKPNIWRITRPLELSDGSGLLPAGLLSSGALRQLNSQRRTLKAGGKVPWVYDLDDDAFRRRRLTAITEINPKNKRQRVVVSALPEEQYLRWMHEATIVETGDTAEGPVVLTFETALPYEDPRRSTIGVFKRYASHLYYNVNQDVLNGTFVGYVPEGEVPLEDLEVMLDWQKIAPGAEIPRDRIDRYWRAVKSAQAGVGGVVETGVEEAAAVEATRWVESAPPFEAPDREFTPCYVFIPDRMRPGKFQARIHQPRIELPRGLQFEISESEDDRIGNETYYRIVCCEGAPGAEGKRVRASEVLALPEEHRSMAVKVPGKTNLRTLKRVNDAMKGVLLPSGIKLVEDTMLRVSVVHHQVSDPGTGQGQIDADGPDHYYLVVDCPARPVAAGQFVKVKEVESVTEEAYEAGRLTGLQEPDRPIKATVTPLAGESAAVFTKTSPDGAEFPELTRHWETVPAGVKLTLGKMEMERSGKVFYPITACEPDDQVVVGMYIRRKEIEILPAA